mgnify:CR=1 FL=1
MAESAALAGAPFALWRGWSERDRVRPGRVGFRTPGRGDGRFIVIKYKFVYRLASRAVWREIEFDDRSSEPEFRVVIEFKVVDFLALEKGPVGAVLVL